MDKRNNGQSVILLSTEKSGGDLNLLMYLNEIKLKPICDKKINEEKSNFSFEGINNFSSKKIDTYCYYQLYYEKEGMPISIYKEFDFEHTSSPFFLFDSDPKSSYPVSKCLGIMSIDKVTFIIEGGWVKIERMKQNEFIGSTELRLHDATENQYFSFKSDNIFAYNQSMFSKNHILD